MYVDLRDNDQLEYIGVEVIKIIGLDKGKLK